MNGRLDKLAPGLWAKVNLLFDEALAAVSLLVACTVGRDSLDGRLSIVSFAVVFAWFVAASLLRLYSPCTPRTRADALILTGVAAAGVAIVLAAMQAAMWPHAPGPFDVTRYAAVLGVTSASVRLLFLLVHRRIEPPRERVLVVGTGPEAVEAYHQLTAGRGERAQVVGFLRLRGQPREMWGVAAPMLGDADELSRVLCEQPVSEAYVAASMATHAREMQRVVSVCEDVGMPFALPLRFLRLTRAAPLDRGGDGFVHYLALRGSPWSYALKRLFDITASAVGLLVLSPLLVGVAIAIKLGSPGPVLFKQRRVGLHGATFNLFKFRSMVLDAETLQLGLQSKNEQSGPVFKMRNDPRITAVGRFIRKYSIDELPQVINILRGDMTVVGPRPALPKEVAVYEFWQRRRLSVRPGLTCFWQVGGRNEVGFDEWMRLDLRYVDTWSFGLDLRLILQTVPVVLAGRGAS